MKQNYKNGNVFGIDEKIVAGFERISEVFRFLLWEKGKSLKLTPIQIQIIKFVGSHSKDMCNISSISREFNITKPTISDTVRTLINRKILTKNLKPSDQRSFFLALTKKGKELYNAISNYDNALLDSVNKVDFPSKDFILQFLLKLINELVERGVIKVQRMCYACRFYTTENGQPFCNFLDKELKVADLQLDCPDFEPIPSISSAK